MRCFELRDIKLWALDKGPCYPRGMLAQVINVVASFLDNQELRTNLVELVGHVSVHYWAQIAPSQVVVDGAVKSARNYDYIGLELSDHREQEIVASVSILVVSKL